ncbi:OLC1v1037924C1 [Oldenlandia corymbosa var. corymbosa]|uniref:OLC1v1037924C1 n=1 Tax=Oldenlandia corymbosa var. corymbosa TaxID=529605 RepID=A0AAV1D1R2_OLDCO|nr:OLC1v1037924C1 [Oldenlandia corymbosa var. corymbosa]
MKIFSWMQSKLSGSSNKFSKPNTNTLPTKNHLVHETSKEEFSDWPSGLLTIGTFGNNNNNHQSSNVPGETGNQSNEDQSEEITNEELRQLQKELKLITKSTSNSDFGEESPRNGLQAEKFLDFLQNLEDERSSSNNQESSSAVCNKGNDDHLNNNKKKICKRSLTFLLKKAFHRTTGKFKLNTPPLADPIREMKLEKSRLEKILRTMLKKKVYPQNNGPHAPVNKILDQKHQPDFDSDDEASDDGSEGSKWVKTDSDYIVLEI